MVEDGRKILFVEDDELMVTMANIVFAKGNVDFHHAANLEEARRAIGIHDFRTVVTDGRMGGGNPGIGDGLEVADMQRARDVAEGRGRSFIVLHTSEEVDPREFPVFDRVVPKAGPISLSNVVDLVRGVPVQLAPPRR
jgi:CheY-like chemotaxis protein